MKEHMKELRKRSRSINSKDKLVAFLYDIIRDYMTCGEIEEAMLHIKEDGTEYEFSNGYLANYAKDIARRLR
jgi:hypothetical protein